MHPQKLLIVLMLACSLCAQAQHTLTADDFRQIGVSYTLTVGDPEGISEGPGGANQTWDFSHLQPSGEPDSIRTYRDPAATPGAASFPNADLAEEDYEGTDLVGYTYWSISDQNFNLEGIYADGLTVVYSDTGRVFDFPFGFGSSTSDTFAATFTSQGVQVNRTGTTTSQGDGYGTLILPGGTYTNTLRVKNVQEIVDSVMGFNIRTTTTSYTWHIQGEGQSVLTVAHVVVNTAGLITESTIVRYRGEGGGNGGNDEDDRWVPHITRFGGGFETKMYMRNGNDSQAAITIKPFLSNGSEGEEVSLTFAPNELKVMTQGELFGSQEVSHFSISGSENISISAGYKIASGEGATAHLPETTRQDTTFRVYPGERDVVFDGMAIVNLGDTATTIRGRLIDTSGAVISEATLVEGLAPKAKYLGVFDAIFPGDTEAVIEINSDHPVSALFLRGTRTGVSPGYLYANLPQEEPSSNGRWIPHVTRSGGGFQTNFYFDNPTQTTQSMIVTAFDSQGAVLGTAVPPVGGGQLLILSKDELFEGEDVSHVRIDGSSDVIVSAGYKVASGVGATAHFNETDGDGRIFEVYPGEQDLVFDGLAIVNTSDNPARITGSLIGSDGSVIVSAILNESLAPRSKHLAVFDELFPEVPNSIIRIESTQNASILFLRGTRLGTQPAYLYPNIPTKR